VAIFFITGADATSIVRGSLSSNGAEHPRRGVVIFWGSLTGALAAGMLLAVVTKPQVTKRPELFWEPRITAFERKPFGWGTSTVYLLS
jgi:hypothetical protein